jgi:hypothetical protein
VNARRAFRRVKRVSNARPCFSITHSSHGVDMQVGRRWRPTACRFCRRIGGQAIKFNADEFQAEILDPFQSGIAGILGYRSKSSLATGVIDRSGKWIVPLGKYNAIRNFGHGFAAVEINGGLGFINLKGELAIKPEYHFMIHSTSMSFRTGCGSYRSTLITGLSWKAK